MPSKPRDAAVERLVEKFYKPKYRPGTVGPRMPMTKMELRAIIAEAHEMGRQSAARECAEIARTKPCMSFCDVAIRERFGLEATDAR